ncbi:MBL fold metallo-hydrolase [Methanofollis fontis]|uniref:MBL fold metallo-hydrolase n=2 Tax=Methanofollis fontis TaxID=2052832 RepID=A0A483CX35_9EURY|nr:MBL fold metallo-hydrolase [Methanofollis fontis]
MMIERIVSEGLSHNSYLIGDGSAAAVIDPRRDIGIYCEIAEKNGLTITHIFETHRNEDYCVGSIDLSRRTGAWIFHGAHLPFAYGNPAYDGDEFAIGSLRIGVKETPGHTDESISLVVIDSAVSSEPLCVFTGDALFAGDVGRTDFFKDRLEEMAGKLYDSIVTKILPLGDGVIVYPAHGAGSVCGGDISDHPFTTVGYERKTNPLLQNGRDEFVGRKIAEHHYIPPYFRMMEHYNQNGAPSLSERRCMDALSPEQVNGVISAGALAIDLRGPAGFAGGHIPGSLNIWKNGLSAFLGYFAAYDRPILFIDDFNENLPSAEVQALRLGYDSVAGYLHGGIGSWYRAGGAVGRCGTCSVTDVDPGDPEQFILDVRDINNRRSMGAIPGSHHVYTGHIEMHLAEIPADRPVLVYCDAGFKGSLAASVLLRHGYSDVTNLLGGMAAWKQAGLPVEDGAA